MTLEALPIQDTGPLMQFSARVGDSSAFVRIKASRLEWSLVGRQWVVQMAPMASIRVVSTDTGVARSNLFVTTTVGFADFCVEPETAEKASALLVRLIAEAKARPTLVTDAPVDLINLKWDVDASSDAGLDFDDVPAHAFGF
jgi:hypothetical protein